MASRILINEAVACMEVAEALGIEQGPEMNAFMSAVDLGYESMAGFIQTRADNGGSRLIWARTLGYSTGYLIKLRPA